MRANQSMVINDMLRSGWQRGYERNGFVHLFRRDRHTGYYPEEDDLCTVFPNGRVADGCCDKYKKLRRRLNKGKLA
jgi:hypothetical protein